MFRARKGIKGQPKKTGPGGPVFASVHALVGIVQRHAATPMSPGYCTTLSTGLQFAEIQFGGVAIRVGVFPAGASILYAAPSYYSTCHTYHFARIRSRNIYYCIYIYIYTYTTSAYSIPENDRITIFRRDEATELKLSKK